MAADPRLSNASASSACNAIVDGIDTSGPGFIVWYDGTIAADADTAVGAQNALATSTFAATAFGAASNGTATAATIAQGTVGVAGTASWARWYSGATATILDCTVGTSDADITFNSVVWSVDATVDVTSLVVVVPKT